MKYLAGGLEAQIHPLQDGTRVFRASQAVSCIASSGRCHLRHKPVGGTF